MSVNHMFIDSEGYGGTWKDMPNFHRVALPGEPVEIRTHGRSLNIATVAISNPPVNDPATWRGKTLMPLLLSSGYFTLDGATSNISGVH